MPEKFPDLKEGDYVQRDDGLYEVRDNILARDINTVLTEDAGVFLRIYRAKPEKAEAMAKIMGFRGDDTRSPGRQLSDVVRALGKGDQEQTARLLQAHFPYLLDQNEDMPFVYANGVSAAKIVDAEVLVEDEPAPAASPSDDDIKSALYRVVAESEGKLKMGDIDVKKLAPEMEKYKFDIETGKPLGVYERLNLAIQDKFAEKLNGKLIDDEGDDDTRDVPTGGSRKRASSKNDKVDPKAKECLDALGSNMKGL